MRSNIKVKNTYQDYKSNSLSDYNVNKNNGSFLGSLNDEELKSLVNKFNDEALKSLIIKHCKGQEININVENEEFDGKHAFDLILSHFIYRYPEEYKKYKKIINGRKLNFTDKKNIIAYLSNGKADKPFCLLTKKEKSNEVRKTVKPRGDIFEKPYRFIPDEEYIREVRGDKRTKLDSFDKMSIDEKIEWARYSNLVLKKYNIIKLSSYIKDKSEEESMVFAMKFACKMTGKPLFQGRFKEAYWIFYRTMKYCYSMTKKESDLYFKILN
jgi:hypothetical protein